ncbi:Protein C52E12.1, partial [Aphelenchoides avenae]
HPKCLFCEQRFFDDEQQYRHLRREHYFCQICDTDGAANVFYARAQQLQRHYEKEHFPCRDPDCVSMGIVFRSKLDLELHEKSHGGEGSRRPIPLDIQFSTGRAHGPMRPGAQHGDVVTSVPGGSARIALVQTPQQAAPVRPENFRIVPSALTQAKQQRIVRSAAPQFAPQGTEFPTLSGGGMTGQREPVPYGAPPGWRQQVQQARTAQAPPITMSSGEQFPSLGPSATSGSKPAGSNTVWGKAKTQDLFKNVAPPRARPSAQEQQKRKPVIPTPDIWPEHIRKKMEARAAGLPVEEEQDPILRAEEHFTAEEKAKRAAKKKAKKQVSASAVTNKLEETPLPSTSKFQTLGAYDEGADEEVDSDDKSGWWSAKVKAGKTAAQQTTTLRPTSDDFVQIDTGSIPVTLRSVAASIAPQKENIPVAKPSSKESEQPPKDGKPAKGKALDHWEDDLSLYDLNDPTPPPKAEEQSEVEKALQNWEDDLSLYDLSDPSDPDGGAHPSLSFTN